MGKLFGKVLTPLYLKSSMVSANAKQGHLGTIQNIIICKAFDLSQQMLNLCLKDQFDFIYCMHWSQCDQIWRNCATWA